MKTQRLRAATRLLAIVMTLSAGLVVAANPLGATRALYRAQIWWSGARLLSSRGVVWQTTLADCGPAALANLALELGRDVGDLSALRRLATTGWRGTTTMELVEAAPAAGLTLERATVALDELASGPAIAWIDRSHFVVVRKIASGSIQVIDPMGGRYLARPADLEPRWSGIVLRLPSSGQGTNDSSATAVRKTEPGPFIVPGG